MNEVSWGALWAALGALFGTVVAGFFAWLTQREKGGSERDIAVIAQWERLTNALTQRIDTLEEEVRELRKENEGLLATIRQNSQSTAALLGDSPVINARGNDHDK